VVLRNDVIAMRGADGSHLPRRFSWPDGHWNWPMSMPYRQAVQCGDYVFVTGQVSMDETARVLDPGDLTAQTLRTIDNIDRVLAELGLGLEHVVSSTAFYVSDGSDRDFREIVEVWGERLGGDRGRASTFVPVPALVFEDMLIEIDALAII
jgi:enamine deaminase RidA (YjgF/YER057c/UK114 family)